MTKTKYYCDRCDIELNYETDLFFAASHKHYCKHCHEILNMFENECLDWGNPFKKSISKRYAFAFQPDSERWDFGNTYYDDELKGIEFEALHGDNYIPTSIIPIPDELAEIILKCWDGGYLITEGYSRNDD